VTIIGMTFDRDGRPRPIYDARGMTYPVRCLSCGTVYDASDVQVLARYTDCTRWKQPCCSVIGDDRPVGWGGTVERVSRA
jgi:hypothetical protein